MMTEQERTEYREDGLSRARREQFRASERAVRAWEAAHPWSLDDYFNFLEMLQEMFGPFPRRDEPWRANDFRL